MKKILTLVVFCTLTTLYANAQTPGVTDIGTGYFNDHQFATYGTISGTPPTLTGSLAGNSFTINFSGNATSVLHTIANYGPNIPANAGAFSVTVAELNFSSVPATNTVVFASPLQPLDQMHVIDIENSESVTFEFLDASNNPVTLAGNIKVVSLSTISPTASLNYPSSTMVGVNTAPGKISATNSDQGFSFIMLTNVVKTIRFIQTSSSTGGSWDFTFSRGTPDRGDAPSTYGNATHISLAARLKLGANGGDAEGSVFSGTTASGDDAATSSTIIDDEDAIASVPTVANNGNRGQVITSYAVTATVTNSTGSDANVMAWADWNGDGVFNASEGVTAAAVATGSTNASRTFTWNNVALNGGGRTGTYLRVRTTTSTLTTSDASGLFPDGEVEDYFIPYAVTLPVTLHAFNVTATNQQAILKWETESEQNNTGFDVEHSTDGRNWNTIGFVPTKAPGGNSSGTLQYGFTHTAPLSGANYYRLKQVDLDGKESYSEIRILDMSGKADGITITPNPVNDAMTVQGVKDGDIISLYNGNGQVQLTKTASGPQVRFDMSRFSGGVYMIVVRSLTGKARSFKVFKQ